MTMRSPMKRELSKIFPQHNDETILSIYDDVIESLGEDSHAFILPTCIEKLLDLPNSGNKTAHDKSKRSSSNIDVSSSCQSIFKRKSEDSIKKSENKPDKSEVSSHSQGYKRKDIDRIEKSSPNMKRIKTTKTIQLSSNDIDRKDSNSKISSSDSPVNNKDDHLKICKEKIKDIIKDVDNEYVEYLIGEYHKSDQEEPFVTSEIVNIVVEYLLENDSYPKTRHKSNVPSSSTSHDNSSTITSSFDTVKYNEQCINVLQNDFRKVPTLIIRQIFRCNAKNYTKTFLELEGILDEITSGQKKVEETTIKSFLRVKREKIEVSHSSRTLADEIEHLQKRSGNNNVTEECNDDGNSVECGCCYSDVKFEDMIQCIDGHLFCISCLQNYSKEAVYGSSKVLLSCMSQGCESTFPRSQLKKALTEDMLDKYMERVQSEDLKLANIKNLIKCPNCDFAADMDDGLKVFFCQNPSCLKQSCRYCQEDWKDHIGISCAEVEKKDVTNLRTTYEEKMTEAKARKCWQCDTLFVKVDGCNKMTCRCGAKMCYLCRQGKINYEHFCQHSRNPGKGCSQCKKCSLWTDPSEDDDRAIAEIKEKAEKESAELAGQKGKTKISIGPAASSSNGNSKSSHKKAQVHEYYGSSEDESDDSYGYDSDDSFGFYHDHHTDIDVSDDESRSSSTSNDSDDDQW